MCSVLWIFYFYTVDLQGDMHYAGSCLTLEDIVNEFSAQDPKTIEAELKDIYSNEIKRIGL